jgi:hypothetical protein
MKKPFIISLVIAIVIIFTQACVTQRRCIAKFPPVNETIKTEKIRDSLVYRDTTIYISLPGERVRDSVPIPCPSPPAGYIPKKVYAETSLAKASAWWSYPVIKLELVQKDTTIEKRLDNAVMEAYHWKSEYEKSKVTQMVKYVPGIYKTALWALISVILAGIIYLVIKIFKSKIFKLLKFL